jgi:hypothetical protein
MSINVTKKFEIIAIVAALAVTTTVTNAISPVLAQQTFTAKLSGNNEVPRVSTAAMGVAQFNLTSDGKQLRYEVDATGIWGKTTGYIHQGKAGQNGPVIATLPMTELSFFGEFPGWQKGTGTLAGTSSLLNLIKNGEAYVNVNTESHPNGAIRGQISSP